MAQTQKFKKGDTVYLVHAYDRDDQSRDERPGCSLVCAQLVTLQSYGKQQGHCTYVENGELLKKRIYPHELLIATRDEVLEFARTNGLARSAESIPKQIGEEADWLSQHQAKARRDVVEQVQRRKSALEAARPSVRVWFHAGETKEDVIIENEQ